LGVTLRGVRTLARILLDLAAVLSPKDLQRAYERAEQVEILDLGALDELLTRTNGHRGHASLSPLAAYDPTAAAGAISELDGSSSTSSAPTACRCRSPTSSSTASSSTRTGRTSTWSSSSTATSSTTTDTFESDRRKWTSLRVAGHELLVFTYRHVADEPGWVVAMVTQKLARRAAASALSV
jgi:hypothetical protein